MKHYNKTPALLILVIAIGFFACQKNTDLSDGPDTTPEVPETGSTDSTGLIKSLTYTYKSDGALSPDSIVESYSYDTLSKTINVSWAGYGDLFDYEPLSGKFTYNTDSLLTSVALVYPDGYDHLDDDVEKATIAYDATNILQQIKLQYVNGTTATTNFAKQIFADGSYQLSWNIGSGSDVTSRVALFSSAGLNIMRSKTYVSGEYAKDSIAYDAFGNVSKIYKETSDAQYPAGMFVYTDFTARQTTGDQLYKLRNLLLSGIAKMPFDENDGFYFGGLFTNINTDNNEEAWQLTKFPFLSASVYNLYSGENETFTSTPVYDASGRLSQTECYLADEELERYTYKLSYYK